MSGSLLRVLNNFYKNLEVLEKGVGFGNHGGFWKPWEVLETLGGFGNLGRFWKPG